MRLQPSRDVESCSQSYFVTVHISLMDVTFHLHFDGCFNQVSSMTALIRLSLPATSYLAGLVVKPSPAAQTRLIMVPGPSEDRRFRDSKELITTSRARLQHSYDASRVPHLSLPGGRKTLNHARLTASWLQTQYIEGKAVAHCIPHHRSTPTPLLHPAVFVNPSRTLRRIPRSPLPTAR